MNKYENSPFSDEITGNDIKKLREQNNWTQVELAEKIEKNGNAKPSKTTISKWENAKDSCIKISKKYKQGIESLILFSSGINSEDFLSSLIGRLSTIKNPSVICGQYKTNWGDQTFEIQDTIEFTNNGKIVIGTVTKGEVYYEIYGYLLSDRNFYGTWINKNDEHRGTCILRFSESYAIAYGNWLGTYTHKEKDNNDHKHTFRYGYWKFVSLDEKDIYHK